MTIKSLVEMPPVSYADQAAFSLPALRRLAMEDGWELFCLDAGLMTDEASALAQLSEKLLFPPWFGGNWSAALDCLRDLDDSFPEKHGFVIVLSAADALFASKPELAGNLVDTLRNAASFHAGDMQGPQFRAVLLAAAPLSNLPSLS